MEKEEAPSEVTFRFRVNQLSKLKINSARALSRPCYIRSLQWQVEVLPHTVSSEVLATRRYLGIFLRCTDPSNSNTWCCYAMAELSLLSVRPGVKPLMRKLHHLFYSKENILGYAFIPLIDVLDIKNGYIENDSITVQAHIVVGRGIVKQLLDLEAKLEEEKKQRSVAFSARLEFQVDLKKAEAQVKLQKKIIEDMSKQLISEQCKEKAKATRSDLTPSSKGEEKRGKASEAELMLLTEALASSERARRAIKAERDELQDEISNGNNRAGLLEDDKRRLEAKIATVKEELEEEQSNNERQDGEFKAKLRELKTAHRTEIKAIMSSLEGKINILEEQLEAEAKERLAQQKQSRNLDKKLKELEIQLQDERHHVLQYKEQVEKMSGRVKAVKRRLEEAEEEMNREKGQKRKAERELENMVESHELMTREIGNLKTKIRPNAGCMDFASSYLGRSKCGSLQPGGNASGDDSTTKDEILDSKNTTF